MESKDQEGTQSVVDQPNGRDKTELFEVNWEEVDIEELKKGYMRNADYTQKTQDISKEKRDGSFTKEELKSELLAELQSDKSETLKKVFLDKNEIKDDSDFYKDLDTTFTELMWSRPKTPENTEKFLAIAFREVKQTSKHLEEYEKTLWKANIAGVWNANQGKTKTKTKNYEKVLPWFKQGSQWMESW